MRRSVSTAVLVVTLGFGSLVLGAGTGNFAAGAQQQAGNRGSEDRQFQFRAGGR